MASKNPYKKAKYYHRRKKSPSKFAKGSLRTIPIGKHGRKLIVGCPKGKYKRGRCEAGMQTESVLTPKQNPQKQEWINETVTASYVTKDIYDDAREWLHNHGIASSDRLQHPSGPSGYMKIIVHKDDRDQAIKLLNERYGA